HGRPSRASAALSPAGGPRGQVMLKTLMPAALACVLLSAAAAAEQAKLKLSFSTSDRANVYAAAIKPFVEAVNAEAKGLLEIEVFFSGTLGRRQPPCNRKSSSMARPIWPSSFRA